MGNIDLPVIRGKQIIVEKTSQDVPKEFPNLWFLMFSFLNGVCPNFGSAPSPWIIIIIITTIPLKLNSTKPVLLTGKAEALGRIARLHFADNNLSEACNVTEQSLEVLKGCDWSSRPLMVHMLLLMLEVGFFFLGIFSFGDWGVTELWLSSGVVGVYGICGYMYLGVVL